MKTLLTSAFLAIATTTLSQSFYYRDDFSTGNNTNWIETNLGGMMAINDGIARTYCSAVVPKSGSGTYRSTAMRQTLSIIAGKKYKLKIKYKYDVTSYNNVNDATIQMRTIVWVGNTPMQYNSPNLPNDPVGQYILTEGGAWMPFFFTREVYFTANANYSFLGIFTSMPYPGQLWSYGDPNKNREAYGNFGADFVELCEVLPTPDILPNETPFSFCTNGNESRVLYTNATASSYVWEFRAPNSSTVTVETVSTSSIAVTKAGEYRVRAVNSNGCASEPSAWKQTNAVTIPTPVIYGPSKVCPAPTLTTLYTDANHVEYQWYDSEGPIAGAVNSSVTISDPGRFYVSVKAIASAHPFPLTFCWVNSSFKKLGLETDPWVCSASASSLQGVERDESYSVFPNPVNNELNVMGLPSVNYSSKMRLYDRDQKVVSNITIPGNTSSAVIDTSEIPDGIYYLVIEQKQNRITERISVQH